MLLLVDSPRCVTGTILGPILDINLHTQSGRRGRTSNTDLAWDRSQHATPDSQRSRDLLLFGGLVDSIG